MARIRTNVTFRTHKFSMTDPIPSADACEQDLGGDCARWLIEQLPSRSVPTEKEPCQEDWGWVVFATRDSARFWIGVSPMFDEGEPPQWIAHIHHGDFSILQRFTKAGCSAFAVVAQAVDALLRSTPDISDVQWHYEKDVMKNHWETWAESPTTE